MTVQTVAQFLSFPKLPEKSCWSGQKLDQSSTSKKQPPVIAYICYMPKQYLDTSHQSDKIVNLMLLNPSNKDSMVDRMQIKSENRVVVLCIQGDAALLQVHSSYKSMLENIKSISIRILGFDHPPIKFKPSSPIKFLSNEEYVFPARMYKEYLDYCVELVKKKRELAASK